MVRVNTWKNVDIEVEVDVDLDEVLGEIGQRVDEAAADYWRRSMVALDVCTKILARVKDEVIAQMPPDAKATMRERLAKELARYRESAPESDRVVFDSTYHDAL